MAKGGVDESAGVLVDKKVAPRVCAYTCVCVPVSVSVSVSVCAGGCARVVCMCVCGARFGEACVGLGVGVSRGAEWGVGGDIELERVGGVEQADMGDGMAWDGVRAR